MFDESRDVSVIEGSLPETTDRRALGKDADRALRRIAKQRTGLEVDELRWLRIARDAAVHVELGFASFAEYVERVLDYGPRTLADKLRVADALETLPAIADAFAAGKLSYSAVREITRVAKPPVEDAWLAASLGRTAREVAAQVAGHKPGDHPDDPTDPDLQTFALRFEVSPEIYALYRDARAHVGDLAGEPLSEEEVLAALCRAALTHGPGETKRSKPPYQVALTICSQCDRGWQDGAGQPIEVGPAVVIEARCDATELGRVDADVPTRATQTIPQPVRNLVMRRDHGRCVVPGCRASRHLAVHHLRHRARGGSHDPMNLVVLCDGHHRQLHQGRLVITGQPGSLMFAHADGRAWGSPPTEATPDVREEARVALVGLGFKPREARDALDRARAHVGTEASLQDWLRAGLRELR